MTGNWTELENYNLRIVSAASIDQTWTALRLRPKDRVKKSTVSNAAIQHNELAVFIDTKNKIVTLPDNIKVALESEPKAFEIYQKLAYGHQKEYLVWILTAKQKNSGRAGFKKCWRSCWNQSNYRCFFYRVKVGVESITPTLCKREGAMVCYLSP